RLLNLPMILLPHLADLVIAIL
ncbi:uncharacterized protein METZ01_LOCUS250016, partial [marine metagenome]